MPSTENQTETPAESQPTIKARGTRRLVTGTVTSNKMDKTVVVTVVRKFRDRHFHKFIRRRVKYHARDAQNECNIGDLVEIVESKPYSKTVRWRVTRTLEKAPDLEVEA